MAEVNTTQGAKLVAGTKLLPYESHGRVRILASKMPTTYASAPIADTIFIGRVKAGTRFLGTGVVSCAAGTASSTISIGLRETATGTVVSATALATGLDIAAAGVKLVNTGAYVAAGAEYITTKECDVYATIAGAALAANQSLKFELPYVAD
jgi:hypothetical protein